MFGSLRISARDAPDRKRWSRKGTCGKTGTPVNSAPEARTQGLRLGRIVKTRASVAARSGTITPNALMIRIGTGLASAAPTEDSLDGLRRGHTQGARLLLADAEAAPEDEPAAPSRLRLEGHVRALRVQRLAVEERRPAAEDPTACGDQP